MRGLAIILIGAAALGFAAAAQTPAPAWREYLLADKSVGVQFPGDPTAISATFPTAGGVAVPTTIYSLKQGALTLTLTVTDFSHGGNADLAQRLALRDIRGGGEVKLDVDECISGQEGRELAVVGKDGGSLKDSVFAVGPKLYELEAKLAPGADDDAAGAAVRFQQSMRFSGGPLGDGAGVQPVCRGRAREASTVD